MNDKQKQVYDYIVSHFRKVGNHPSVSEIRSATVGHYSRHELLGRLFGLEAQGLIKRCSNGFILAYPLIAWTTDELRAEIARRERSGISR